MIKASNMTRQTPFDHARYPDGGLTSDIAGMYQENARQNVNCFDTCLWERFWWQIDQI